MCEYLSNHKTSGARTHSVYKCTSLTTHKHHFNYDIQLHTLPTAFLVFNLMKKLALDSVVASKQLWQPTTDVKILFVLLVHIKYKGLA